MKKLLLSLTVCIATISPLAATSPKFDAASRSILHSRHIAQHENARRGAPVVSPSDNIMPAFVRLDPAQLKGAISALEDCGLTVKDIRGSIALVEGTEDALTAAACLPQTLNVRPGSLIPATNNLVRTYTGAETLHTTPASDGHFYTGAGVVVGVFDSGFDLQHPAFRTADGHSRVRMLATFPNGNGDDTAIYTDAADIDSYDYDIDSGTHGTHVLGTIGADYEGSDYNGVAPGADLAVGCGSLYDSNIGQGVAAIADYAAEKGQPCVINLSLAEYLGPHDGTDEICQWLYESTAAQNKAILVMSAGNEGAAGHTFVRTFTETDTALRSFLCPELWIRKGSGTIAIWSGDNRVPRLKLVVMDTMESSVLSTFDVEADSDSPLHICTEDYSEDHLSASSRRMYNVDPGMSEAYTESVVYVDYSPNTTLNNRPSYYITYNLKLNDTENKYARKAIGFVIEGDPGMRVDVTLYGTTTLLHSMWEPGWEWGTNDFSVSSMACVPKAVCVGAYYTRTEWEDINGNVNRVDSTETIGNIASWSSHGTLIDGTSLPHVAAPGGKTISTMSTPYYKSHPTVDIPAFKDEKDGRTNYWTAMQGTSMASPAVAGIIAMWLEADPSLTADDIHTIIRETSSAPYAASRASSTEPWGAGKIDAEAGLRYILAAQTSLAGPSAVTPSAPVVKTDGTNMTVTILGTDTFDASLTDLSGRRMAIATATDGTATFDLSVLTHGIYVLRAGSHSRKIVY